MVTWLIGYSNRYARVSFLPRDATAKSVIKHIFTVTQLAYTFRPRRNGSGGVTHSPRLSIEGLVIFEGTKSNKMRT